MRNLIVGILVLMLGAGCATKDEKARTSIARTWRISKVYQHGTDVTESYLDTRINYRLKFNNGGDFQETYIPFSGASTISIVGNWVFSDGINKITLTDGNQTRVYRVDELIETQFNITDLGSTNKREIHFVPS